MRKLEARGLQRDFMRHWSLFEWHNTQLVRHPSVNLLIQNNAFFLAKDDQLPDANWRQPKFVVGISKLAQHARGKPFSSEETPQPNVSIEQESH